MCFCGVFAAHLVGWARWLEEGAQARDLLGWVGAVHQDARNDDIVFCLAAIMPAEPRDMVSVQAYHCSRAAASSYLSAAAVPSAADRWRQFFVLIITHATGLFACLAPGFACQFELGLLSCVTAPAFFLVKLAGLLVGGWEGRRAIEQQLPNCLSSWQEVVLAASATIATAPRQPRQRPPAGPLM